MVYGSRCPGLGGGFFVFSHTKAQTSIRQPTIKNQLMKPLRSLYILFFAFYCPLNAQSPEENLQMPPAQAQEMLQYCGHDLVQPTFNTKKIASLEQAYYQAMQVSRTKTVLTAYTLPVVVHIIHENGMENISDDQVLSGIAYLNLAFANTGYYDPTTGVSTPFQFCLAKQDPEGNATTGINRVVSGLSSITMESEDLALKNLIRWDPTQYINIWLVKEICSTSLGCNVAGYAFFPDQHGLDRDGVVMEARWMGSSEANSVVLVHELGHYFGLKHTFQGGCVNDDCLMDGDGVCDTRPDQTTAPVPCDGMTNSCSTDVNPGDPNNPFTSDDGEHFRNYMDYGDLDCYTEFTQGQSDRMEFFLNEVRFSLLNSQACIDPCPNPILALFESSASNINVGENVAFSNFSQNATGYAWYIEDMLFSTVENPGYVFSEAGSFDIKLVASGSDPLCLAQEFSLTITVSCPVYGTIAASDTDILPGETINFTSVTNNATSFAWYVNGDLVGNGQTFDYSFEEGGYYEVYLISANGLCTHRSNSVLIGVDSPCQPSNAALGLRTYPDVTWLRCIEAAPDGGCLIGGEKVIFKKDAGLNDQWIKIFDADGVFDVRRIRQLPDSTGFLLSGVYEKTNVIHHPFIIRIDNDGNIVWDIFLPSTNRARLGPIVETGDGNFIAAGNYFATYSFIVKFSPEGDVLWCRTYDENVFSYTPFYSISPAENGAFIVAGHSRYLLPGNNQAYHCFACKIDSNGNVLWSKIYTSPGAHFTANDVEIFRKSDNSFILAASVSFEGLTLARIVFLNIGSDGELLNIRINANITNTAIAVRMKATHDGNILVIIGSDNLGEGIIKMDQNLNILWSKSYPGFPLFTFFDIIELPDHTSLAVGFEFIPGNLSGGAALRHMDEFGFLSSCLVQLTTLNELDIDFLAQPFELIPLSNIVSLANVVYTLENITPVPEILCPTPESIPDVHLNFISAETCPNRTYFELEICNTGNVATNTLMPVAFYTSNPTEQFAEVIRVFFIGQSIPPGDCFTVTLQTNTPVSSNRIFAIINDNASLDPIFSLLDFPVTSFAECNFTNNIGSVENTILESPTLDLGPDQTLCPGAPIPLNAGAAISYLWSNNATGSSINISQPGTYWVRTDDGCRTQRDTIVIHPYNPAPLELGENIESCENAIHVLDAGPGYASYRWNDLSTEQTLTTFSAGTYWVAVTDACDGTIQHDTIHISTMLASAIDLGPDTSLCRGDTLTFSIPGFETYQWYPEEGVNCPDCSSVRIAPSASGTYTLVASLSAGCISVDTIYIEVLDPKTCISSAPFADAPVPYLFNVFPNPNSGLFEVEIDLPGITHYELRVYNTLGQILTTQSFSAMPLKASIDLSEAPSGVYLVQLVSYDKRLSRKVLVLR